MLENVTKLLCKSTRENSLLPQIIFSRYLSKLFFYLIGCWSVQREDTWTQGDLGLVFNIMHLLFSQISSEIPRSKLFCITFWYIRQQSSHCCFHFIKLLPERKREIANSPVFQLAAAKCNCQCVSCAKEWKFCLLFNIENSQSELNH